ncbi:hypothetical protein [Nocardia sp. NPDC003726]
MHSDHRQTLTEIRDAIEGELRRGGAWDDLGYAVAPGAPAHQTLNADQVLVLQADLKLVQDALDGNNIPSDEELSRIASLYTRL